MRKHYVSGVAFEYAVDEPNGTDPSRAAGPTIVLVHGFPLDNRVWSGVAEILKSEFRVVRPNLRGFGTLTNAEPFSVDSLAADLHELLAETGDLPCVLVGLSMGGYVALSFADQWADDLAGLVLVDTKSAADTRAAKTRRDEMAAMVDRLGSRAVADLMMPDMLAPGADRRRPAVAETLRRIMEDAPALTVGHALLAMRDRRDFTDTLAKLDGMPAAVVVGGQDQITPVALAREMAGRLHNAELTVIEGAGHISPMEDPAAVAASIASVARRAA